MRVGSYLDRLGYDGPTVPTVEKYVFSLTPRRLEEFAERCLFQQTSPESHFTRNLICSHATESGRVTLSGMKLIVTTGERREEREVRGAEELRGLLTAEFGIEIGTKEAERLATRAGAGPAGA